MPQGMKIIIILPTYNERQNLGPLLEALQEQFATMRHDMHVLVVDDNSPDGTADVAREAGRRWGNVHLLMGKKNGLGVAYVRGFAYSLEQLQADAVVQMDADLSHNPADVPRLIAALEEGADVAIGSRYVKGGRAPKDWGPLRRGMSLAANLGARIIAPLYRIHDCTNGFRAIRASTLRRMDFEHSPPRGYVILVYVIYQALSLGALVREVPVSFSDRTSGTSKLRLADMLEFFINLWWIRYHRRDRFYGLALGGLSGIAANIATIIALRELAGLPLITASALAIEVSVLSSFAWREFWALATKRRGGSPRLWRLAFYNLASLPSMLLTLGTFSALTGLFSVHYLAAQTVAIVPALLWNYFAGERLLSHLWPQIALRIPRLSGPVARPTQNGG